MKATENLARKLKIDERAIRAAVAVEDGGGDSPDSTDYLCFTAVDGDASVSMLGQNLIIGTVTTAPTIYYSFDKVTWTSWIENNAGAAINLTNGQSVYMYGENPNGVSNITAGDTYSFQMTGKIEASGNIQTLLSKAGDRMDVPPYAFAMLFEECTSLTTAPSLPATTLADNCYKSMFEGCTSLVEAPALPATTLAQNCYSNMFKGCTALTEAPELPATILAPGCYGGMFSGCTSLTSASTLPATTLVENCYSAMFQGCTALTVAPVLPATTLVDYCYLSMFIGCSKLQSVTTNCVNWNTFYASGWLQNAGTNATNPTVYCPADSTIPSDSIDGIPTGWTRADLPTE